MHYRKVPLMMNICRFDEFSQSELTRVIDVQQHLRGPLSLPPSSSFILLPGWLLTCRLIVWWLVWGFGWGLLHREAFEVLVPWPGQNLGRSSERTGPQPLGCPGFPWWPVSGVHGAGRQGVAGQNLGHSSERTGPKPLGCPGFPWWPVLGVHSAGRQGVAGQRSGPGSFAPASLVVVSVTARLSQPEFAEAWGEWQTEGNWCSFQGFLRFSR